MELLEFWFNLSKIIIILHYRFFQGLIGDRDYESLTLMRLRQAEERKRLKEQMAAEDD